MQLPIFQVDAFTADVFGGNPAAVCPLETWLPDQTLQSIAAENNLSETAFFVPAGSGRFDLRWFTPTIEVDLCGHATLATAFVILSKLEPALSSVRFSSASGDLAVERDGELLVLDFPARPPLPIEPPEGIATTLGVEPLQMLAAKSLLAILADEQTVKTLQPNIDAIAKLPADGLIISAPGDEVDFVSRYFAPHAGIAEDPVTGAAHTTLTPYWATRLGKETMQARQISAREGALRCEARGDRVRLAGQAVLYLEGTISF